jgi:toxin-antitoxin system PIN domain toxin
LNVFLLDVNVLMALVDPMHVYHDLAHRWFEDNRPSGWATCPITENGFIRILSHPSIPSRPGDADATAELLASFCDDPHHHFWPDDAHLRDVIRPGVVFTHAHVTDLYLLGLAVRNGGELATFDRRIPAALIDGGDRALTVIPI